MKKLRITELAVKVTEAVIDMGIDPLTAWTEHNSAFKPLLSMQQHIHTLNPQGYRKKSR